MPPLVFADVRISYPEFQKINQQFALKTRWFRFLLLPALVGFVLWNTPTASEDATATGVRVGATLLVMLASMGYAVFNFNRTLKKQYAASPLLQATATYTLTEAGVRVESPLWRGTTAWTALRGFRHLNGWIYLVSNSAGGYLLNPACLQAPATEADVLALLQRHGLRLL